MSFFPFICNGRANKCVHFWVLNVTGKLLRTAGIRFNSSLVMEVVIVNSHVTFGGINALIKWFWSHPFHRKFFGLRWAAYIFIDLSHQPKVWHFDLVAMADKNITGSKVSVNKIVLGEMILITNKQRKKNNFNLFQNIITRVPRTLSS